MKRIILFNESMTIETIREKLSIYFQSQPVAKAWLFGSYARGEQTPESDIDILVDFDPDNYPSLLKHSGMINELEDLFKTKIDIVPSDCLYSRVKKNIENQKILIYERV